MSQYGWTCPRCRQVNAPWASRCDCVPETVPATANPTRDGTGGSLSHTCVVGTGGFCTICGRNPNPSSTATP